MDASALAPWGVADRIEPVGGGVRNETAKVRIAGRVVFARRSSRAEAALAWEAQLLVALAAAGLHVAAPIPTLEGRLFAGSVMLTEWISGKQAAEDDWNRIAELLASIHELTRGWPQRPGFASSSDLLRTTVGGDVDLAAMPAEAVERCRAAWRRLPEMDHSVVHGDPRAANIIADDKGQVVAIDWDEARVDHPWLDRGAMPASASGLDPDAYWVASQAAGAWEAATCWRHEPGYARERLASVVSGDADG